MSFETGPQIFSGVTKPCNKITIVFCRELGEDLKEKSILENRLAFDLISDKDQKKVFAGIWPECKVNI